MCMSSPPVSFRTSLRKAPTSSRVAKRLYAFWSMPTIPNFSSASRRSAEPAQK